MTNEFKKAKGPTPLKRELTALEIFGGVFIATFVGPLLWFLFMWVLSFFYHP